MPLGAAHLLLTTLLLAAPAGPAASPLAATGVLEGNTVDTQGGALPGGTVSLRNLETGQSWTRPATDGTFRFEALNPGRYELHVSVPGFALKKMGPIEVSPGQQLAVTAQLQPQVDVVTEAVAIAGAEVVGAAAAIATHRPSNERPLPTHQQRSVEEAGRPGA